MHDLVWEPKTHDCAHHKLLTGHGIPQACKSIQRMQSMRIRYSWFAMRLGNAIGYAYHMACKYAGEPSEKGDEEGRLVPYCTPR